MKQKKENCSLYIHIPFCERKCLYCDFLSMAAGEEMKKKYVQAVLRELNGWTRVLQNYRIQTIFVGGGTPTCLSPGQMEQFIRGILQIMSRLEVADDLEFTMEANPGTILWEHISVWQEAGVNRISLGLQSAQNRELQALGRIHSYEEFLKSYNLLRESGFLNVNIDLMSDIPLQTMESYVDTLNKVISLKPEHISAYSLMVEEGTPFYEMAERGILEIPSEEVDRQMYLETEEILKTAGYFRYEISNYAKPGYECRHNLTYWDTKEYLGVGLGASSCLGGYRFQNRREMKTYLSLFDEVKFLGDSMEEIAVSQMKQLETFPFKEGKKPDDSWKEPLFEEIEQLTDSARKEEFMFLGLRKTEGVLVQDFSERFGESLWDVYRDVLPGLIDRKLLKVSAKRDRIFLTRQGIDVSNIVLAEFLL